MKKVREITVVVSRASRVLWGCTNGTGPGAIERARNVAAYWLAGGNTPTEADKALAATLPHCVITWEGPLPGGGNRTALGKAFKALDY